MKRQKQTLLAAVSSTVCAVVWLINCVLDIHWAIRGSLIQDALLTLVWAAGAVLWWLRWHGERRISE